METPKKTYSKQGGRPKVGIGRIHKYVVARGSAPNGNSAFRPSAAKQDNRLPKSCAS